MEINKIYLGDCLELIKELPDNSIDAIITDPPYAQGLTHNGQKGCFNDLQIVKPFFNEVFKEFKRVLKDEYSAVYFFTDFRGYALYYPLMQNWLPVRNMLVWDKGGGMGNFYTFAHELILYAVDKPKRQGAGYGPNVIKGFKSFSGGAKKTNGEKVHPTQKTIELIEKIILDTTDEGDVILDTFMGSGTTAIAAMRNQRNFIGFELDEQYFEIAQKRILDEKVKTGAKSGA